VEAIRIVYGPNSILLFSPDVEIAVDTPEREMPKCLLSFLLTLKARYYLFQELPFFLR